MTDHISNWLFTVAATMPHDSHLPLTCAGEETDKTDGEKNDCGRFRQGRQEEGMVLSSRVDVTCPRFLYQGL